MGQKDRSPPDAPARYADLPASTPFGILVFAKPPPAPIVEPNMHDPVNAPAHYRAGSPHETIKVLEAWLTPEQFEGYLRGNVIKYVSRAGLKGSAEEDLGKARWYLNRLLELHAGEAA